MATDTNFNFLFPHFLGYRGWAATNIQSVSVVNSSLIMLIFFFSIFLFFFYFYFCWHSPIILRELKLMGINQGGETKSTIELQ